MHQAIYIILSYFYFGCRTKLRGVFFNSCHLLDYFFRGLTMRMLFICGKSLIFAGQISIKIIAL